MTLVLFRNTAPTWHDGPTHYQHARRQVAMDLDMPPGWCSTPVVLPDADVDGAVVELWYDDAGHLHAEVRIPALADD